MKRVITMVALLSAFVSTSATVSLAAVTNTDLHTKLEALERQVWEGFKGQNIAAIRQVIAADAMGTDMNGLSPATQIEPMLKDYVLESYSLKDFKLIRLGRDAAVLLYTSTQNGKFQGQAFPAGPYYCSTTFVERRGKWMAIYHQETLAASAMGGEAK